MSNIVIKGTGGIDTPSINATSNAVFGGTVDFTQAVLKGINKWETVATNSNVFSNRNYFVNTGSGSLTLTLPTSANVGDVIVIQDSAGFASSNNITINRNGHLIDGSARNAILNIDRGGIALTFESATNGFVTRKDEQESQVGSFQGEVSGYTSGGLTAPTPRVDTIDKFSFATDANATDVGNLTIARQETAGQSSDISGYNSSGESPSIINAIDKFPFATDANATDVGDVTQGRREAAGQSSSVSGYTSGGTPGSGQTDLIDKFPFATDSNATDVGDLTAIRQKPAGQSSDTFGYTSGGYTSPGATGRRTIIDKFPFASDVNATDSADLTLARNAQSGQSSSISGYNSGGYRTPPPTPGVTDTVDKFSFASNSNATDVGNLTQGRYSLAGQSSTVSGYTTGGTNTAPSTDVNIIDKFPFASDANSSDVGDLFQARLRATGQQV